MRREAERTPLDDVADRGYECRLLAGLFPDDVVTAWGDPKEPSAPLFPEEEALVERAIPKRRQEFAKGRECAREALVRLGLHEVPLLSGAGREPLWPTEVVGSITHTTHLCAVAVARSDRYAGIGIDAEPAEPLRPEIAKRVCSEDESARIAARAPLDRAVAARLVFSAKEAVYKCLYPIARKFLGFEDVTVTLEAEGYRARLRVSYPPFAPESEVFGRWQKVGAHFVTSAWLERAR